MTISAPTHPPADFADERAALGNPSFVWRFGQDRRLDLICRHVPLEGRRILDVGCGIGTYVKRLRQFSDEVYGFDVAADRVRRGARDVPNLMVAEGEHLPFHSASFDVVILNEVIEHVRSDRETMVELARVLRPGGHAVFFAPNRFYPFETHGIYFGKRYVFGNIPLVNYLPNALRNRVVPHARAYLTHDFRRITRGLPFRTTLHTYVYPGFDNIAARSPVASKLLRRTLYAAEGSWLRIFGLSHLLILERLEGIRVGEGA
ncbi:MAG: class I SAM-dependent methyltransferase [Dehalococcoidia bacterium]